MHEMKLIHWSVWEHLDTVTVLKKIHILSHNELGIDVLVERVNEMMFLKVKMQVLFWHEGHVCIFWKME